jgi:threonine/homoserine/homoserine lactone efflux protein
MTDLVLIAGGSFVLGLSGACMPGPLLTVTIAESLKRGIWAGPLLILGHALLEGAVVVSVFYGFGDWLSKPSVFTVIALIGGLVLIWMAVGMLRGLSRLSLDLTAVRETRLHPVASGALVSLANPYFTLWWATVGLGYLVVAHKAGMIGVVVFYVFHILSDLAWYSLVACSVTLGRNLLSNRVYRGLVGCCAVFLLVFGVYFSWQGVLTITG